MTCHHAVVRWRRQRREQEASDSSRLGGLVRGSWEETHHRLSAHPALGEEVNAAAQRLPRDLRSAGIDHVMREMGETTLDLARSLAAIDADRATRERLERVEITMIESEDPVLSTQLLPDGTHLIRVSDTFLSGVGFMFDLIGATERTRTPADREQITAAVRLHLVAQCVHGRSMIVGYRPARTPGTAISAAVTFALAHELGHVAGDHVAHPPASAVEAERAADVFAAATVARAPWLTLTRGLRRSTHRGIAGTLLSVELRRLGLFVRPPTTHDPYDVRLAGLATRLPWLADRAANAPLVELHETLRTAGDLSAQLPGSWWTALFDSPTWQTDTRAAHENTFLSQADQVFGRPTAVNLEVLGNLERGGRPVLARAIERVLVGETTMTQLLADLDVPDREHLLDPRQPLSRKHLCAAIAGSPVWHTEEEGGALARRTASLVAMELLEPLLTGEPDGHPAE